MPKYKKTNITAKRGVNYIKNVVEESGCIFHKIEQENDLGIDGIIEFIIDEEPVHKSIALQIKSGQSYFNKKKQECLIPVETHYEYWKNYPLPVFGLVYVPEQNKGYWIDIKNYFEVNGKVSRIKYSINRTNEFDLINFKRVFMPFNLNEVPEIPLEEALSFFESDQRDEFTLGMIVLFRNYVNEKRVWMIFFEFIRSKKADEIPLRLIHYISHIPGHPDIFFSNNINKEIIEYSIKEIKRFDKEMVVKLLSMIDEEMGIARGSIGQSIEAIISKVDDINKYLEEILIDDTIDLIIKHSAALIYGYYNGVNSLRILKKLKIDDSWFIPVLIEQIEEFKGINPYG